MSSLTLLLLLIFCLMSLGNLVSVASVFGYDANHWQVSNIFDRVILSYLNLLFIIQDILYIICLNVLLWIGVAVLCSLFEYDIRIHPCVSLCFCSQLNH